MMLSQNAELAAVMEVTKEFAEKIAGKYGVKYAYDNENDLLENPEIEAVYIASPVAAHYGQTIKAARNHKHILLEKPLALTSKEGAKLVAVCEKENVLFASGLMMRYHAYHQKAKELVNSGALGQIVSMRAQLTCWYPEIEGSWRQNFAQSGGGALMDMGIHCIDLLQFISGAKAAAVSAVTGTKTFSYDVDDSASLLLEFDNGACGYVDTNFNIPDNAAQCRLEIYGTKGSILANGTIGQTEGGTMLLTLADDSKYSSIQNRNQSGGVEITAQLGNMYEKEITSFGNSILNGTKAEVPASDAWQVQKIIECAYQASHEKRMVEINIQEDMQL
jgi:predicted dehydrogenase